LDSRFQNKATKGRKKAGDDKPHNHCHNQVAEIFFLDEAGFQSDPVLGRTYGLKGQTPVVATSGQRQSINAISAVNAKGAFWYDLYTGKLNAARFLEFLRDFMKGRRKPVFLVVDGHPSHTAKVVRAHVQSLEGRLELHFLPPYAPDLNPDEFVWSYTKTNGGRCAGTNHLGSRRFRGQAFHERLRV